MIQDEQIEALVDEFQKKLEQLGVRDFIVVVTAQFGKGFNHKSQMAYFTRGNFYASLGATQEFLWGEQHKCVPERSDK